MKGECAIGFLDVRGQATKEVAQVEAPVMRAEEFGGFKPGLGVGAEVVDEVPKLKTFLKPV